MCAVHADVDNVRRLSKRSSPVTYETIKAQTDFNRCVLDSKQVTKYRKNEESRVLRENVEGKMSTLSIVKWSSFLEIKD